MTRELNNQNFKEEVLESTQPVLIDFYASWCAPCRMVAPVVEEIAKENTNIKVFKVDVDTHPGLAAQYQVSSIPTLVVIKNGELFNKAVGAQPKEAIITLLDL